MARLNQPQSSPVSPLRLLAIMVFLISISGGLVYLFAMPLKQVYWGGEPQEWGGRTAAMAGTRECPATADRSQGPMAVLPPAAAAAAATCPLRNSPCLLQCMPGSSPWCLSRI